MLKEALGPELHRCKIDHMPPDREAQPSAGRSGPPPNSIVEVRCARCAGALDREPVLAIVLMIPGKLPALIPQRRMGTAISAAPAAGEGGRGAFLEWASGESAVPARRFAADFLGSWGDLFGALQTEPEWNEWSDNLRAKVLAWAEAAHRRAEELATARLRLSFLPVAASATVMLRCDSHGGSVQVDRVEVIQGAAKIVNAARPRLRALSERGEPAGHVYVGSRGEGDRLTPPVVASV